MIKWLTSKITVNKYLYNLTTTTSVFVIAYGFYLMNIETYYCVKCNDQKIRFQAEKSMLNEKIIMAQDKLLIKQSWQLLEIQRLSIRSAKKSLKLNNRQ